MNNLLKTLILPILWCQNVIKVANIILESDWSLTKHIPQNANFHLIFPFFLYIYNSAIQKKSTPKTSFISLLKVSLNVVLQIYEIKKGGPPTIFLAINC